MVRSQSVHSLFLDPSCYDQKLFPDAYDALLGVHCITLTLALERSPPPSSGFTLSKGAFSRPPPPHTPLTHFVRSKSSSLAYRLAFVIYNYKNGFGSILP